MHLRTGPLQAEFTDLTPGKIYTVVIVTVKGGDISPQFTKKIATGMVFFGARACHAFFMILLQLIV